MNNEFYLLKGKDLIEYIDTSDKKSLDIKYIKEKCYKIAESYTPRLKYLDIVDKLFFEELR